MFSNSRRHSIHLILTLSLLLVAPAYTIAQQTSGILSGRLWDKESGRGADSILVIAQKDSMQFRTFSANGGRFSFGSLPFGTYKVNIAGVLFKASGKTVHLHKDQQVELTVEKALQTLQEVFITASEAKAMTSTSVIDRRAMQHLQPSSFTDLLELLPGGRSKDPSLTTMNRIRLREAGAPETGYDISSLGTAFLVDGAPINTTANLQSTSVYITNDPNQYRNTTNRGVDMRTLSTDDIEKVEIVRGIPSVEYGDLTSGLIKIERKKGYTPFTARMKTDGFSKLFALGKGFNVPGQNMSVNVDFGFLDSKSKPTDNFTNYKRINSSVRAEKRWENSVRRLKWTGSLDYATTIDNQRTDPDNGYAPVDKFRSRFNRYVFNTGLKNEVTRLGALVKSWEVNTQVDYQRDRMDVTKWVQARSATILANALTEGEHDATFITPSYAAELLVDGRPFNAFLKAKMNIGFRTSAITHDVKLGLETNYSKNFGKGQVYDLTYPMNPTGFARPRAFDTIPGMLNQSFFAEDMITFNVGRHKVSTAAGLRGMSLLAMDGKYAIANKIYLDPRINMRWALPGLPAGQHRLQVTLGAGFGLHTKMPTLDMLYPNPKYTDIVQLNFYHNNPEYRKANVATYVADGINYHLKPAVNRKLEFNGDFELNGNRLSLTYFHEKLTSGFRAASRFRVLDFKIYDNSSVDAGNLTAPPATSDFNYEYARQFFSYSVTANGSALIKEGIEFQFVSRRLTGINTRFTVNGAWFKTNYVNSFPLYKGIASNVIVDGKQSQYVGVYDYKDGAYRGQLNTNLTVDSYLPVLGLTVSASLQNIWYRMEQYHYNDGTPVQYMGVDGILHPYTKESLDDPNLVWLKETTSGILFQKRIVPVDLQGNVKVTKEFKKKAAISMFVNRLFTYTPDYVFNNTINRRSGFSSPYFGMELNLNF